MSRANSFIRFPLAAAMLAAMGTATGGAGARTRESEAGIVVRADVPEPALEAIAREAGGLDFGPVTVTRHDGASFYQADMVRDGHVTGVEVDAAGAVQSLTTELSAWELPLAVKRIVDAETLGFPARSFTLRESRGVRTYTVDAATERRGKRLELSEAGEVLNKELKLG